MEKQEPVFSAQDKAALFERASRQGEEVVYRLPSGLSVVATVWRRKGFQRAECSTAERNSRHRLLCLHGWMDNRGSWLGLAEGLVQGLREEEVEMVAIDLPGHGASTWLNGHGKGYCWYGLEDYLGPLVSLVRHCLQWDSFTLIGHSMGSTLSMLLTLALPSNAVQRLVLIEGLGPNSSVPGSVPHTFRVALEHNFSLTTKQPKVYPSLEAAIAARTGGHPLFGLSSVAARALVERGTRQATQKETEKAGLKQGVLFTHDPLLRSRTLRRFSEPAVLECLAAITCPTLFIYAERGVPTFFGKSEIARAGFDQRKRAIQDLRELYIPGEGHHVHLEAPGKVLPALLRFLQDSEEPMHESQHARL